jgi:hypothetical protein
MERIRFYPLSMNHPRFTILRSYINLVEIFTPSTPKLINLLASPSPSPLCSSKTLSSFALFSLYLFLSFKGNELSLSILTT